MRSSWQTETGQLAWRWQPQGIEYRTGWLNTTSEMNGSHLPPPPDFASHSPFGGPSWFELHVGHRSHK